MNLNSICLDLRVIRDIVHHGNQRMIGGTNILDVLLALTLRQILSGQHLRHSHSHVHRRANLMGHIGQEAVPGLDGIPCFLSCLRKIPLHRMKSGHILQEESIALDPALNLYRCHGLLEGKSTDFNRGTFFLHQFNHLCGWFPMFTNEHAREKMFCTLRCVEQMVFLICDNEDILSLEHSPFPAGMDDFIQVSVSCDLELVHSNLHQTKDHRYHIQD